jgi:hypothetical protein
MSEEKTEKKLITKTFKNEGSLLKKPAVNFDVDRFDSAILKHGYDVIHHRALRCPCVNKGTGSPLPNCQNCRGLGWFYINATRTKALVQNLGNKPNNNAGWSEKNAGTTTITTLYEDDVSYMDKFEIEDLEGNYTQILQPNFNEDDDELFAFTIYKPKKIFEIFAFVDSSSPLLPLSSKEEQSVDWDYYSEGNKIVFNTDKWHDVYEAGNMSVSLRYKHTPVYCVIDIQREVFKARDQSECSSTPCPEGANDLHLRGMPQKSIGRRLHYIWDANNQNGPSVFDNSSY